jgi:hypothetical protein
MRVEGTRVARLKVSRAELTRILTERMRTLPYGKNCTLAGVLRLPHPDASGCNWMPGVVSNSCRAALADVFKTARLEFNLHEE